MGSRVPLDERVLFTLWFVALSALLVVDCLQFLTLGTMETGLTWWNVYAVVLLYASIKVYKPKCKLHEML